MHEAPAGEAACPCDTDRPCGDADGELAIVVEHEIRGLRQSDRRRPSQTTLLKTRLCRRFEDCLQLPVNRPLLLHSERDRFP